MNQLIDQLTGLGHEPVAQTSDEVVSADLRRAHAGLARRRQRIGGASLAVLAVAGIGIAGAAGAFSSGRSPTPTASNTHVAIMNPAGLKLVAYTGAQPNGFHISAVPQGYRIASSTAEEVRLVPSQPSATAARDITISLVGNDSPVYQLLDRCQSVLIDSHGYAHPYKDTGKQRGCYAIPAGSDATTSYLQWNTGTYQVLVTTGTSVLTKQQDIQFANGVTTTGHPRNPDGSSADPAQSGSAVNKTGAKSKATKD